MTLDELRAKYLNFFEQQGHVIIPSSPLVPENDPTTLFTSSGMQPLVPYLLGQTHPQGQRLCDSQRSFRSQDIEEVGDNRHTTFFEMLGNWSLGDYFKKEQLAWIFEFLTQVIGLDPHRLYVTVFAGNIDVPRDEESIAIWKELFGQENIEAEVVGASERGGMQAGRIFPYGEKKNWWSRSGTPDLMPIGEPGGPDSEIFFDFGTERRLHENSPFKQLPCHVNCDCGRFLEIGNSVFMQYQKQENGTFKELPQRNVDFGGGLERILAAVNDDPDVFKTDAFTPVLQQMKKISGIDYSTSSEDQRRAMRIIADHIRASVFLISDGVIPSQKQHGAVLRRLFNRILKNFEYLEIVVNEHDVLSISEKIFEIYRNSPYKLDRETIQETIGSEIFSFLRKIELNTPKFYNQYQKELKINVSESVHAEDILKLELRKFPEINVDAYISEHKNSLASAAAGFLTVSGTTSYGLPAEYTLPEIKKRWFPSADDQIVKTVHEEGMRMHGNLSRTASSGMFKGGLADHSATTTKYHTATHLLQAALRKVLGTHVQQRGSNITVERLRFDFAHQNALTEAEKQAVEQQINAWIEADLPVTVQTMKKQAALDSGAIAFFVEKYPEEVTVYTIGHDVNQDWISKELCGGPHVPHTGVIGKIKITKEQAVAAGTRRIYLELILS